MRGSLFAQTQDVNGGARRHLREGNPADGLPAFAKGHKSFSVLDYEAEIAEIHSLGLVPEPLMGRLAVVSSTVEQGEHLTAIVDEAKALASPEDMPTRRRPEIHACARQWVEGRVLTDRGWRVQPHLRAGEWEEITA